MAKTTKLPAAAPEKVVRDPAALAVGNEYLTQREQEKIDKTVGGSQQRQEVVDELTRTVQARVMSQPEVRAASVIRAFDHSLDINNLAEEMRQQSAEIHKGNMDRAEAMLIAQAHTLDALFANLARRAHSNMEGCYLQAMETYLRLALRAQSQCRATLETLSAIKNPPVVYAKQMNVAHGPQQINNGTECTRTENVIEQNKLSGDSHELLPDT